MKPIALSNPLISDSSRRISYSKYLIAFIAGLLGPLGFAPFNVPGLSLLSLAILFSELIQANRKQGFILGLSYGLAYFGFGVSWVAISIHDYGHINYFLSGLITLLFVFYLSLFPAGVAYSYSLFKKQNHPLLSLGLFSSLWCLGEFLRANLMTGFPWLLLGTSQINSPLKYLAPILGIYGLSFLSALAAGLLALVMRGHSTKRFYYLVAFVLILITPTTLKNLQWTTPQTEAISIGAVQANLSMRDKWDETLFWNLLKHYNQAIDSLLGNKLIILPESAIPLPSSYLEDYLNDLDKKTLAANSALLLGIIQPTDNNETNYYNSIITLGHAKGQHTKRQLVPFGEYIPQAFVAINRWLNLPEPNVVPGLVSKKLISIMHHPIASLICYEIAYPKIVRQQMPKAQWIVSISDNGWFGHSLASYQQQQMAQMLSLLTGRYQILVNNDGLSSVINPQGEVIAGLPSFSAGILHSEIYPVTGITPWIKWSDYPILSLCLLLLFIMVCFQFMASRPAAFPHDPAL